MTPHEYRIEVASNGSVTSRHFPAPGAPGRAVLILAHGAGADQRHRFMTGAAAALASRGVDVVTFNFLYTEQRHRSPDRAPLLEQTWTAVVDAVAARVPDARLVVGGKSMGGRIASQVLAARPDSPAWSRVSGLVLLGYPLHPPGRPEQPRTSHLPAITAPILLVQGTRDAFGTRDEIEPIFSALPTRVDFEYVEGGDHSFAVPKSSGRSAGDVMTAIYERVAGWILG